MVRVIMAAGELTGDMEQAIYWFRNEPIVTLKRKTAAELVAGGHADAVMAHLAERIWQESTAHRPAFAWGTLAPTDPDRVGSLRAALAATMGTDA